MKSNEYSDYQSIFLNDAPLIDLRAPIEFELGAFPSAVNLPLMSNEERQAVGICYKQEGKEAALSLGHRLVSGELKQQRLEQWADFCQKHPDGFIYCYRGGLRSHIVQQWLADAGIDYPLIKGGYKRLRNYLLEMIEQVANMPFVIVSGNTGGGKTRLINQFHEGIDLEGLACHRGSSFGRTFIPQSTQINFENRLASVLIKKQQKEIRRWILEDESRNIGVNHVPLPIYQTMTQSPIVVIDDPFETRLKRLQEEYIDDMCTGFRQRDGEALGWQNFAQYLQQGLDSIRKRLGYENHQQLSQLLQRALTEHMNSGNSEGHLEWLALLLTSYYDPMYTYQLDKKQQRIRFRGNFSEVKEYLMNSNIID